MKKRKLNSLDAVIIAVLIIAVAGGAVFYMNKRGGSYSNVKKTTIEFDILAVNLTEQEAQSFKNGVGTSVTIGKTNSDTATVKNVKIEPYKKLTKDLENERFLWAVQPNAYQAIVTVSKEVNETDTLFVGEKEEIRIGANMPFLGKGFGMSDCFVTDLREAGK